MVCPIRLCRADRQVGGRFGQHRGDHLLEHRQRGASADGNQLVELWAAGILDLGLILSVFPLQFMRKLGQLHTKARVLLTPSLFHLGGMRLALYSEVIVAVVVGFSKTGDGHNHRQRTASVFFVCRWGTRHTGVPGIGPTTARHLRATCLFLSVVITCVLQ